MVALARDVVVGTKIDVSIRPRARVRIGHNVRVGNQGPHVILFVDHKPIPMRTKQAVELYLELASRAEEITQMQYAGVISLDTGVVLVTIERDPVMMWPEFARKLAGALMRRADLVDDWQISHPRMIQ